ncbi:MAG: molybdopterin molybdotransferase MoeA [Planctomycetaceae bacterium]|nr:molybdopterin molybdotransferase MoeA [Planctomycetaceae bacterium]
MSRGIALEQALTLLAEAAPPPTRRERVPLLGALGRVLARPVTAEQEMPPFNRSPYDGYAVNHRDIADASAGTPVTLTLSRRVYAGDPPGSIGAGEACAVATGAAVPAGADCVVMQEDVVCDGGVVIFSAPMAANANVSPRGEEIEKGQPLLSAGDVLTSGGIAVLAGQGLDETYVYPRVRAAVVSTGSELAQPGAPLAPGKIYDSNRFLIAAMLAEMGADVVAARVEVDDPERLAGAVAESLEKADVLVTTGGVSVGERDCMPAAASLLGARTLFHGVAIRPGGPVMALSWEGKIVLCLSGNPFAAAVTAFLLARPLVRRLNGIARWEPCRARAVMADGYPKGSPARRFVPAWLEGGAVSFPAGNAGMRSPLALAWWNCLLDIPAGSGPLAAGDSVETVTS